MSNVDQAQEQIPDDVLNVVAAGLEYRDPRGWIPWAWAVLSRAGDVPVRIDEDLEEYPAHLVTLAGLGHLFELFHEISSGGSPDLEPGVDLVGKYRPEITTIEIARYCEREGVVDRAFPETADGLLREAIGARAPELRRRLLELLGGGRLFTSLYIAGEHEPDAESVEEGVPGRLPSTDDAFDGHLHSVVNEDLTSKKQRTYAWLEGDLDLG
ncbi:MAG TPA: hypothetical protein VK039_06195 [Brevibacterium sp.]|nr:hypothetical protein [Brevibacterium sp.]